MAENTCWCGAATDGLLCTASEFHNPLLTPQSPRTLPRVLYIAGPMSGYDDCNYPAFHEAAHHLRTMGYTVFNPAETGAEEGTYSALIAKDLRLLLKSEAVAVLEGWWASVGARNEVCNAGIMGMPVRSVGEWIHLAKPIDKPASQRTNPVLG